MTSFLYDYEIIKPTLQNQYEQHENSEKCNTMYIYIYFFSYESNMVPRDLREALNSAFIMPRGIINVPLGPPMINVPAWGWNVAVHYFLCYLLLLLSLLFSLDIVIVIFFVVKLITIYFHFLSNWMDKYDRRDNFPFDFDQNGIPSGSKSKRNCPHDHISLILKGNLFLWTYICILIKYWYTENSFRNLIKSNRNQIVFTIYHYQKK